MYCFFFFFFNGAAPTEIYTVSYTLSLHDALPISAGADPGPACYGRGGTSPTVTDASLVLGYYDPGFFLGGRMALDTGAAERALDTVAAPLGMTPVEAAWGIHKVVSESMA